ncbi:S-adenosyl-L-methionine-dependent methyltransferase [Phlyctochytrium arcticum]|nr:S-adenosyl-L-methionine-dependent methyltransferase [Phlyctochytrium arcticum]
MYGGAYCDDARYEVASSIGDAERDLHSEFGDENDTRWDDWEEEESEAQCPFCPLTVSPPVAAFEHCRSEHAFDFKQIRSALGLDFYGSIRLINHVRNQAKADPSFTAETLLSQGRKADWIKDDALLQPVLSDDALLYAFEDEDEEDFSQHAPKPVTNGTEKSVEDQLREQVDAAENRAMLAERRLDELTRAFVQYKDMVREAFLDEPVTPGGKATVRLAQSAKANGVSPSASNGATNGTEGDEEENPEWAMDYYFGSYAETEIHESMLKDRVRTESYRDFVYHNKDFFKGKVVLDVGCGTGILSMFAARAGASKVIAVDNSTIINKARRIVKENGLDNIITFVQGKVEEVVIPVDSVDIIISEWMGYFLLYEGMLDSVLVARDRWLAPDGILAPSRSDILIAAIQDEEWINDKYSYWTDVYGFKMETMKHGFLNDGNVDFADPHSIISTTATLKRIDIADTTVAGLDFESPFKLEIAKDARVNGLVGWFDIYFEGTHEDGRALDQVFFSTGPKDKGTHWKQTLFAFENALEVTAGSVLEGIFKCEKSTENHRELNILLDMKAVNANGEVSGEIKRSYTVR